MNLAWSDLAWLIGGTLVSLLIVVMLAVWIRQDWKRVGAAPRDAARGVADETLGSDRESPEH